MRVIEQGNKFLGPTQANGEIPLHGKTCGNAVFNDPSILSCPFHMVPMNYVSAVIYGAPRSTPFLWSPAWIFHREPTGKSKIAQFKEVIKTVHNQYLSLDGHWWGSSASPSPHPAPHPTLCPPALLIDSCSAPSNKPEIWASCSHSGLNWHVSWIIKWPHYVSQHKAC